MYSDRLFIRFHPMSRCSLYIMSMFSLFISADDVVGFERYIDEQLAKVEDVPDLTADDMPYMQKMMLTMYANPLKNKMSASRYCRK